MRGSAPAFALAVVSALGLAASVFVNWPGHFPPDAITQLAQGRAGVFNLWHPPVMAWLLGLADRGAPDAPAFFVMDAALFFGGLTALTLAGGVRWAGVAATAVLCASPLVLIYQGLVVKDVLFADASLAAFAAIAWAGKLWPKVWARLALAVAAVALLTLAALVRQNGVMVAGVGALTLGCVAWRAEPAGGKRARTLAITTLVALLGMGGAFALARQAFEARSDHQPEVARQWMMLQIYDLAGADRRDPTLTFPILHARAPSLERFIRGEAAPAYDPTRVDPISHLKDGARVVKTPSPWVAAQWRQLMTASPALYLATRGEAFWQVLATPDVQACAPVFVGVDPGDPAMLRRAGLVARETDQDDWDGDYATAFLGTPVFSHLASAALAIMLLVLAVRGLRRGGGAHLIAVAGLLTGSLAFAASFFVVSIACDFRYLYFLDVAAMAALVQRIALWRPELRWWRQRPG